MKKNWIKLLLNQRTTTLRNEISFLLAMCYLSTQAGFVDIEAFRMQD
jgi:hypothetical protein